MRKVSGETKLAILLLALALALGIVTWALRVGRNTHPAITNLKPGGEKKKSQPVAMDKCPDVIINAKDDSKLILIPAGEFTMGSLPEEGYSDEQPRHRVYLNAYYIGKYEVSNRQFARFVDETGYKVKGFWKNSCDSSTADDPANDVTWHDAVAYCKWAGLRLPTEAEWEKAARGTDERIYPWGNWWPFPSEEESFADDSEDVGETIEDNDDYLPGAFVGMFLNVSPFGCLDMVGNSWEWCSDWYGEKYYGISPASNPEGPGSGIAHILRGSSWRCSDPDFYRCASRGVFGLGKWGYGGIALDRWGCCGIGFRVARSVH